MYQENDQRLEVVLCGRRVGRTWNLPKGTPDGEETIIQTAVREACEETGLVVVAEELLGDISYRFTAKDGLTDYQKTVYFFLMSSSGGSVYNHDPEFDEVKWFDADEAIRALTFPNEATILRTAIERIRARRI